MGGGAALWGDAMKKKQGDRIQAYLNGPYSRILVPNEDGSFSAELQEFPGCFAQGDTEEEALRNLEAAAREWLASSLKNRSPIAEPFSVRGFSGALSLRIPRGLHRQAARLADREGTSLNQYIATAIAARVGADDLIGRMAAAAVRDVVVHFTHTQSSLTVILPRGDDKAVTPGGTFGELRLFGHGNTTDTLALTSGGASENG